MYMSYRGGCAAMECTLRWEHSLNPSPSCPPCPSSFCSTCRLSTSSSTSCPRSAWSSTRVSKKVSHLLAPLMTSIDGFLQVLSLCDVFSPGVEVMWCFSPGVEVMWFFFSRCWGYYDVFLQVLRFCDVFLQVLRLCDVFLQVLRFCDGFLQVLRLCDVFLQVLRLCDVFLQVLRLCDVFLHVEVMWCVPPGFEVLWCVSPGVEVTVMCFSRPGVELSWWEPDPGSVPALLHGCAGASQTVLGSVKEDTEPQACYVIHGSCLSNMWGSRSRNGRSCLLISCASASQNLFNPQCGERNWSSLVMGMQCTSVT